MRVDNQTIMDIDLFSGSRRTKSLYSHYNQTETVGGSEKMYNFLRNPLSDLKFLEERKSEINFFCVNDIYLELKKREIDFIEHYRNIRRFPLRANWIDAVAEGIQNKIAEDGDYYIIHEGILKLLQLLHSFRAFIENLKDYEVPESLLFKLEHCNAFLSQKKLKAVLDKMPKEAKHLNWFTMGRLDTLFRMKKKNELQKVLDTIYLIDVLQSLSNFVKEKNYSLPEYKQEESSVLEAEECFHPFLDEPVKNSFRLNKGSNLCFITGPNMSGKSTFLKTVGLIIYLSHLGFPVPAKHVTTSIYKGLFTTINLSDNLNLGLSHFYSEVKRVKDMALELKSQQKLIVIFDELFKGTNVKDAYDSTLMVVRALSKIKNSIFFVSSHILEVAEDISGDKHVDFRCFESTLKDDKAIYDYKLKDGISRERVGFQIVKREKIEEILKGIIENQT